MASKRSAPRFRTGRVGPVALTARFVGVSALAGVLAAGVLLPAVGTLGVGAKASAQSFDSLPGDFKRPPLSQASHIYDSKGNLLATVYDRDRTVVKTQDIAPTMRKAIVAIEDARFYQHGAVDPKGILRALNQNAENGGVSQGASTLTQQYVKNVFVEDAGNDPKAVAEAQRQTIGRKVREMKYAIKVEEELTKTQILTNYLNITFFGEQAYGVEAAAQRYFSVHAKDLSLAQSAMLAGVVQSPSGYDPLTNPKAALDRRNTVLRRMAQLHAVTPVQAAAAEKTPLGLNTSKPKNGCITATSGSGFFCDYVKNTVLNDATFGKTAAAREKLWKTGGLEIHTTLDPQAQASSAQAVTSRIYSTDPVAGAVVMVEPGTGRVTAMAQSRPYGFGKGQTTINYSVDKDMGGSNYGFQTGSTFKPFTAAAALEKGISPGQTYKTGSKIDMSNQPFSTCNGTTSAPNWQPQNELTSEKGTFNMATALQKSINTYFVKLSQQTGLCEIATLAEKMNVHMGNGKQLVQSPSLTLGGNTIAPLTMAAAYATFANEGSYCTPVAIDSITTATGKQLAVPKTQCSQVMQKTTADTINTMLLGVVQDGTGKAAGLTDRESAGKTGTTDNRMAAWFLGYTTNMVGAVWMGDPANKQSMYNLRIGPQYYDKVEGADGPGPIWKLAMSGALSGKPAGSFQKVSLPTAPSQDGNGGKKAGGGGDNAGGSGGAGNGSKPGKGHGGNTGGPWGGLIGGWG
ncbi:penicillin-binding protein [Mangrovactinospora gilvigrisea]|uniref:Penicillin-binding protein n=1 Tax=Mangrovactinospora gilvigrisea TaxID=1428644 RepID=A0A1J7BH05_9ACTN|nr:transglycosylase domain-containing protein [Mangrovactinospora gilvigrisea]OIV37853.1 penicillin-binding protein [Mangrovactinospora gilvigrisea]